MTYLIPKGGYFSILRAAQFFFLGDKMVICTRSQSEEENEILALEPKFAYLPATDPSATQSCLLLY